MKSAPFVFGVFLVGVTGAFGADAPPPAVADALRQTAANEATPAGSDFDTAVGKQFEEAHADAVEDCAKGASGANLDTFNLFMKLDPSGKVMETLVFPETTVAKCLKSAVAKDKYPAPGHSDYWVRIELALKP
jgi:hypothetical protein